MLSHFCKTATCRYRQKSVVNAYTNVEAITRERDERLNELDEIKTELKRLEAIHVTNYSSQSPTTGTSISG